MRLRKNNNYINYMYLTGITDLQNNFKILVRYRDLIYEAFKITIKIARS